MSGITKSGSIPSILPKPSQVGHAPIGLLKVKKLTDGSVNNISSSTNLFEKILLETSFLNTLTTQVPSPSTKADSTDSAIRALVSSFNAVFIKRSIRSKGAKFSNSSSESFNKLSILSILSMTTTREKPCSIKICNCFENALPFGTRIGQATTYLLLSSKVSIY